MEVRRRTRCAFTLVELLIVIIIIAVLAAIAVPKFSKSVLESKEEALRANLSLLRRASDRAEADTGLTVQVSALISSTPPAVGWIRKQMGTAWTTSSIPAGTWKGPYLDSIPINPITGKNDFSTGKSSGDFAWTHLSAQSFNSSYVFFPSTRISSEGTAYRTW